MFDDPRIPICLALLVLTCGQILLWRRRDNVLGYLQAGTFFSTIFAPLFFTTVVSDADPRVVDRYVQILLVGAVAFAGGLCFGAPLGKLRSNLRFTFARPFGARDVPAALLKRSRWVGVAAAVGLAGSFALLSYVPLFAGDRRAAKYGIGLYAGGFQRGAIVYHLALAATGAVLPVMLAIYYRRRRGVDLAICAVLGIGVLVTLSRGDAFTGPLLFLVALAVERRVRAWLLLVLVCFAFVGGALANELIYTSPPAASSSFVARVSANAPDVRDQLGFLQGFQINGEQHVGVSTITSALDVDKGEYDPADYALRILTGLNDVSGLAAGGIRLPAPLWGYAAFGLLGTFTWSFVSGFFTGWGTVKLRELLTPVEGSPGVSLNLVLAATLYLGTFGLAAHFYFPERSGLVVLAIALVLCIGRRGQDDEREGQPSPVVTAGEPGARAAPQSGSHSARAAPQSGSHSARAAPQSGRHSAGLSRAGRRRSGRPAPRTAPPSEPAP